MSAPDNSASLGRWRVQAAPVAVDPSEQIIDPRRPAVEAQQLAHEVQVMKLNRFLGAQHKIATTGKAVLIDDAGQERTVRTIEEAAQITGARAVVKVAGP